MVANMHWPSPEERRALGQARRKQIRRQDHSELKPKTRRTPALELLKHASRGRIASLVQMKYQLMAESPFGYFRGATPVMAADLSVLPNTGIHTQICGDAHVRNLGAYAAPDGRLVFDINDFDETIHAPFEWDLKRMAASLVIAGREAGHKDASTHEAVLQCIGRYTVRMGAFAKMPTLEVSRFQVHRIGDVQPIHDALQKAERATPLHTLEQLTESHGAGRCFRDQRPMLYRIPSRQSAEVLAALGPYRQMLETQRQHLVSLYRPVDIAFKVVGTGSVGLRDYCIYFEGNGERDPLFLQMKEEAPSAYTPYLGERPGSPHQGQRVVEGQRAMQLQSDPFLGWTQMGGRDYLVRQLNDHKGSIELNDLTGTALDAFAHVCGDLLARGHARSGDPLTIAGYLGSGSSFAEALAEFGARYADQTEKDCGELRKWLKSSRQRGWTPTGHETPFAQQTRLRSRKS